MMQPYAWYDPSRAHLFPQTYAEAQAAIFAELWPLLAIGAAIGAVVVLVHLVELVFGGIRKRRLRRQRARSFTVSTKNPFGL